MGNPHLAGAFVLALAACGATRSENLASGGAAPTSSDGQLGDTGPPGPLPTGGVGDGPKLDVGSADDGGQGGCQKIDVLFVVDNSGSMEDEQGNLVTSFPGFIAAIRDGLMAQDYQIMVVTTDSWPEGAPFDVTCSPAPACCFTACAPPALCNGAACPTPPPLPTACGDGIGAGRKVDALFADCPFAADRRFLVEGDPDLEGRFACVGRVGTIGAGFEQPMLAMTRAVSASFTGPGGCNEGFVRDDAILVVTVITDEEDIDSPGDSAIWHAALREAKSGNEQAVVFLGLLGDPDLPGGLCEPLPDNGVDGAQSAPQLRALAESFTHGSWASVCAPDYAPFFADAIGFIDAACQEFVPPG